MNLAYQSQSPEAEPYGTAITADGKAVLRPLEAPHLEALEGRSLNPEIAAQYGVLASSKLPGNCIAFPFIQRGECVNVKHRTLGADKRFIQDVGGKQVLWNGDCLRDPTLAGVPLIITEGELDALAAIQSGYPRTVSMPGGAPAEEDEGEGKRYDCLDAVAEELRDVKEIILATDGDGPGANLMHGLRLRLGAHRCKFLKYPPETKDLNEVLDLYGEEALRETIRGAQWLKVDGVYRLSDLPPVDTPRAYDPGIVGLSEYYKVRKGDFVVVTGIPGHGKTSLVNEVCCRMALSHKWNTAFCSLEQSPVVDHKRALRSFHGCKREYDMTLDERARADEWIDQRFSFIVPNEDDETSLTWFLEKAAAACIRFNVDILVLDPWNEMDHTRPKDMSLTEYVGFAIRQLRRFAKKYNVHLIVVAHPAKLRRDNDGQFPVPTLYDISDSAHWYNKADIGLVVHRPSVISTEASITNIKSRYAQVIGRPGGIKASWNPDTTRFTVTNDGSM